MHPQPMYTAPTWRAYLGHPKGDVYACGSQYNIARITSSPAAASPAMRGRPTFLLLEVRRRRHCPLVCDKPAPRHCPRRPAWATSRECTRDHAAIARVALASSANTRQCSLADMSQRRSVYTTSTLAHTYALTKSIPERKCAVTVPVTVA